MRIKGGNLMEISLVDEVFEIYLEDLPEQVQKNFLDFMGLKDAKEGNFDVFPIASIAK